ncbi:MAG: helix-turn-helix transcriptional regulator [Thermoleophilia bacterium]
MKVSRTYTPRARDAARLLGAEIRAARTERRWTIDDLAERVGASRGTIGRLERGDMTVALGIAFEAAALVGVPLFHDDARRRALEAGRIEDRLSVLPKRVRRPVEGDDDF